VYSLPSWEQFNSLSEFTLYIIKAEKISFFYFVNCCIPGIQNIPKFKHFIDTKIETLPPVTNAFKIYYMPMPIARPLQLIYQQSFWDSLLEVYFEEFHTVYPVFSIKSFNPKTCSSNLLSAIYYLGFNFQTEYHEDLKNYMDKYAELTVKKTLKSDNLENCQALFIFAYIKYLSGDLEGAKFLQAYLTRMAYSLGLHLDCKHLPPVVRYNRKLTFTNIKWININIAGSYNFAPNYLTEYGESDVTLFDPRWQKPDETTYINYNTEDENEAYSTSITVFHKFQDACADLIWIPSFYSLESDSFMASWNSRLKKLSQLFGKSTLAFLTLKQKFKKHTSKLQINENQVKMHYHFCILELYEILKHRNNGLKPDQQTIVLSNCDALFDCLKESNIPSPFLQVYAYLVALHYLNIYPHSFSLQKKRTKERLQQVINYLKGKFLKIFSLNYLMLEVGFDLIEEC
jgi:hypothetical protein